MSDDVENGATYLYRFYTDMFDLLYVGITSGLVDRFEAHMKSKDWWHGVRHIDIERYPNRASALAAEKRAIESERPRHNVIHGTAAPKVAERSMIRGKGLTSPDDLKYVMRCWGVSQQVMAEIFGVTRQAVSKWVAQGIPAARIHEVALLAVATEDVLLADSQMPLAARLRRPLLKDGSCLLEVIRTSGGVDQTVRLLRLLADVAA